MHMDQKQSAAVGLGIVSMLGLFAVVYTQYGATPASAPEPAPAPIAMNEPGKNVPEVVAEPQTFEEVEAAISAQLAEDEKAFEAEMAAESSYNEEELKSLDELNNTYDEKEQ